MNRAVACASVICIACGPTAKKVTPPVSIEVSLRPASALWYGGVAPIITGATIATPGIVIGLNNDSDGPAVDSNDNLVNGANDAKQMTSFIIIKRTATTAAGDKMHVTKKSGSGNVRVFRKGDSSTGILTTASAASTVNADATSIMNDLATADVELYVEGTAAGDVELCAQWAGSAAAETCAKLLVVDGYGAATGYGPRIYGNTNRDTSLTAAADLAGHDTYTPSAGAITFTNLDKDCPGLMLDDEADTTIACADDEADIAHVRIDKARIGTLPSGWKPVLRFLGAGSTAFRLFDGVTSGSTTLSTAPVVRAAQSYFEADLSTLPGWAAATTELTLGLEGRTLDVRADPAFDLFLCITHVATKTDASCDKMAFRTNSALLQPNTEVNRKLVIKDHPLSADLRAVMRSTMPTGVDFREEVIAGGDPWLQDEIEVAGIRAPRGDAQLVLHLPRAKGLTAWATGLVGASVARLDLKASASDDSPQFGGNLECTPPALGGQGHMIMGDDMESGLVSALAKAAPSQTGSVIPVDWLMVGHVDEVAAVFPKTGGSGWGTTVADPDLAKSLLIGVAAKASLFWHCRTSPRTRAPECFGEGVTTSASAQTGATPAKLTASGFTFTRPAGREFQWIRVYAGTGRGQIALIKTASTTAHSIEVVGVLKLPSVAWTRCAPTLVPEFGTCDPSITMPATQADIFKATWFTVPDTTSRFVVVEESLRWGSKIPALVTAGELRDTAVNPDFWGANHTLVVSKLTGSSASSVASVLAALPGGSPPVRVPVLYSVLVAGGALIPRQGDALLPNVTNYQIATGPAGTVIYVPKPWGPSTGGSDPFETKFRSQMAGASATIEFVDDWDLYHVGVGEVHCGTNLFKATARKWWP